MYDCVFCVVVNMCAGIHTCIVVCLSGFECACVPMKYCSFLLALAILSQRVSQSHCSATM